MVLIGLHINGDWIIPSIESKLFSIFLSISNLWEFPDPILKKVTAVPTFAFAAVVAILKLSLSTLIAYTSVGKFVPETCCIAVLPIPLKVDPGV